MNRTLIAKLLSLAATIGLSSLTGLAHAAIIPSGIQANVSTSQIASWGWTECSRSDAYASTSVSSVTNSCQGDYLAMGIWDDSLGVYGVVGIGNRAIVTNVTYADYTGDDNGTVQNWSNGLNWYRTSTFGSWGFTTSHQTALHSADINLQNGLNSYDLVGTTETELAAGVSFHIANPTNFQAGWAYNPDGYHFTMMNQGDQRVFWTAARSEGTVPEPASIALLGLALAGLGVTRRKQKAV